jgi:cystathionine beta-lyase family protein involved in aluminum resistance
LVYLLLAQVNYRVYSPAITREVAGVVNVVVGRVTHKVGVSIHVSLRDGDELMTRTE